MDFFPSPRRKNSQLDKVAKVLFRPRKTGIFVDKLSEMTDVPVASVKRCVNILRREHAIHTNYYLKNGKRTAFYTLSRYV